MDNLQNFQKLVIEHAKKVKALQIGDMAPNFVLPNAVGSFISLENSLKNGAVVLKFYRGEWCPICNLDLRKLQKLLPEIENNGASLIAISPQSPNEALTMKMKNELGFEVLSDDKQKVIKDFGLQFDPGEDYHQRRDLSLLNGDCSLTLPIPATYIIDEKRIIRAAHVEADYTQRLEPDLLLKLLKEINMKTKTNI